MNTSNTQYTGMNRSITKLTFENILDAKYICMLTLNTQYTCMNTLNTCINTYESYLVSYERKYFKHTMHLYKQFKCKY